MTTLRTDPVVEFYLGLAALAAALAVALLFAFPPGWLRHPNQRTLYAEFPDVGTLARGADVREHGNVVGHVDAISALPDRSGLYRVKMTVSSDWHPQGQALVVDDVNPVHKPGLLAVAKVCRNADHTPDLARPLCCTDQLVQPVAAAGHAVASCGRLPSLVDRVKVVLDQAQAMIADVRQVVGVGQGQGHAATGVPMLIARTGAMLASVKVLTDRLALLMDTRNRRRLSAMLGNLDSGSASLKTLLQRRRADIDASIVDASSLLRTTTTSLPFTLQNLQKVSQNLKAITAEVRSDPALLVRGKTLQDPSFVAPEPRGTR